jgi:hypothetical protein
MTLHGTVRNGLIVLDPPGQLPDGTRVEVVVRRPPSNTEEPKPSLAERLMKHAGTVPDLPSDLAEQHDHYIHGTPRASFL